MAVNGRESSVASSPGRVVTETLPATSGVMVSGASSPSARRRAALRQSAAMAGDPTDFESVNANLKRMLYRGVSGTYNYKPEELTAIPYPDDVNDPSLGMPHLTFQI